MGQTAVKQIEELNEVSLTGVVPIGQELGRGAYGRVFTVKYSGEVCAAKEIHPLLIDEGVSSEEREAIKRDFVRECLCCSTICHRNIVKFKGVYYSSQSSVTTLPVMVMELMHTSLNSFIEKNRSNIEMAAKISVLCDVSNGLNFLHTRKPTVIHRDLSSNNVMLTNKLVAKIGDLGVAKVVRADSTKTRSKLTTAPGTLHFMPPEALDEVDPVYGTPIDVFSFAGIALHLFSEEWPTPSAPKIRDPATSELVALSEAGRRQKYLDKMTGEAAAELKQLIKNCLDDDPIKRPSMGEVKEKLLESPPLVEALQTKQYHLKWDKCSDLPKAMYDVSVVVDGNNVYFTAGSAPENETKNNVYCYDISTDQWNTLSPPGHCRGVLCMVDNKLSIFGGCIAYGTLSKVSTYDRDINSWSQTYPAMINERLLPGVAVYGDHVMVMGGEDESDRCLDNIEMMNWQQKSPWKEVSTKLPVRMWNIKPTLSGEHLLIVGYSTATGRNKGSYQIPVSTITSVEELELSDQAAIQWKQLSPAPYYKTATVPYSNPPLIIGGSDVKGVPTSDISLYDTSKDSWIKVDSLTSAGVHVGVATINNNTIIVIGSTSGGDNVATNLTASSLPTVEIGHIVRN